VTRFAENSRRATDHRTALKLLQETAAESGYQIRDIEAIDVKKQWPERRMTVRYDIQGSDAEGRSIDTVYGKLYRGSRGARSAATLAWLHTHCPSAIRVPRLLGYHERRRFLLMTAVPGRSLMELMERNPTAVEAHVARVGTALAEFQRLETPGLEVHDSLAELRVLASARARVAEGDLPLRLVEEFDGLCRMVGHALSRVQSGAARRLLHRDLHPAQILPFDGGMGLIDLDDLAMGEAELDLGNLSAHFYLFERQRDGASPSAKNLTAILVAHFSAIQPMVPERLTAYQAASLLRLSSLERLAAADAHDRPWPEQVAGLLSVVNRLLKNR